MTTPYTLRNNSLFPGWGLQWDWVSASCHTPTRFLSDTAQPDGTTQPQLSLPRIGPYAS